MGYSYHGEGFSFMTHKHTPSDPMPSALPAEAMLFLDILGPESALLCCQPKRAASISKAIADEVPVHDAVLREVFLAAHTDTNLLGEFLNYYTNLLVPCAHAYARPMPHNGSVMDLINSIYVDLLPIVKELKFDSELTFLSLLTQRLGWKVLDHQRKDGAERRRDDLRVPSDMNKVSRTDAPLKTAGLLSVKEDCHTLMTRIAEFAPADRTLFNLFLSGKSALQVGEYLGISSEAARKRHYRLRCRLQPQEIYATA
jgi:RNA polymerase sigma factor (sigma-70 family)